MNPIEQFIRGTLGCRCPDEVFRSISLDQRRSADGGTPYMRLLVGERLLIYIVARPGNRPAADALAELMAQGCLERDDRGYNRFRLVAVCDEKAPLSPSDTAAIERSSANDERAHLHCLPPALLPPEFTPRASPSAAPAR